jgi:hypothetical protein
MVPYSALPLSVEHFDKLPRRQMRAGFVDEAKAIDGEPPGIVMIALGVGHAALFITTAPLSVT